MSNFRRVKKSHVFVKPVHNSFELFICAIHTREFFTRVTDSFECQTNLSQGLFSIVITSLGEEGAVLNLNIHTSYFSHAVNYSHEYVTFWYV